MTELHILVPVKGLKDVKPMPQIRSFLITGVILQYHGHDEAIDFLQDGSHATRTYAFFHQKDLTVMLEIPQILPEIDLRPVRATISILAYCGRPSTVMQMH